MKYNRILKKDTITPLCDLYGDSLSPAVNDPKHRQRFKEFLESFDHHEEFYTETDLHSRKITWEYGIRKWLQYEDFQTAPVGYMTGLVHPFMRDWYNACNNAAVLILAGRSPTYLKSRYVITLPVRKEDGHFVLVKQMSMPFGYDEQNRVVTFINSFTIFDDYHGEPIKLEMYEGNEKRTDDWEEELLRLLLPCIEVTHGKNLTNAYFSIISAVRQLRAEHMELSDANIAERYTSLREDAIDGKTAKAYLREIRARMHWMLEPSKGHMDTDEKPQYDFWAEKKTALQVIYFMDQSGIIRLLKEYAGRKAD